MTEKQFHYFFFLELAGELTIIILRSERDTRLKKKTCTRTSTKIIKGEEPEVNTVSIVLVENKTLYFYKILQILLMIIFQ